MKNTAGRIAVLVAVLMLLVTTTILGTFAMAEVAIITPQTQPHTETGEQSGVAVAVQTLQEPAADPCADGHTYKKPTWTWSGATAATASFACENCNHVEEKNATSIRESNTPATCTQEGQKGRIASVAFMDATYESPVEMAEAIPMLQHDYSMTWEWNSIESVSVAISCKNTDCSFKDRADAVVTKTTTATCVADGVNNYTGTITYDGKEYDDVHMPPEPQAALGHDYTAIWAWGMNPVQVSATFKCKLCNAEIAETLGKVIVKEEIPATCSSEGKKTDYGVITLDEKPYTSPEKITMLPIRAHMADTSETVIPTWTWANDYTSATAAFPCMYEDCDGSAELPALDIAHTEASIASCTQESVKTHTATCGTHEDIKVEVVGPMLKHQYIAKWSWFDEQQQALVGFQCQDCTESASDQVPTITVVKTNLEPTCLKGGEVCLSGSIEYQGQLYEDLNHMAAVAPLGHAWDTAKAPAWTWAADKKSATASFPCVRKSECGVEHQLPATISKSTLKAATCSAVGKETITASVVFETNEFHSAIEAELPMLAHTKVVDPAVKASTKKTGLTEGSHCSVCSKVLAAQVVIPKYVLENSNSNTSKTCKYGHTVSNWRYVGNQMHRATCTVDGCGSYVTQLCDRVKLNLGDQTIEVCDVCGAFGDTSLMMVQGAIVTAVDRNALPSKGNLLVRYLEIMNGEQKQYLLTVAYENDGVVAPFKGTVKVSIPITRPIVLPDGFTLTQVDVAEGQLSKMTKEQRDALGVSQDAGAWAAIPYTYENGILTFEIEAAGLFLVE